MTASNCSASLGASAEGFLHSVQVSLPETTAVWTGGVCCPLVGFGHQCFFFSFSN